MKNIMLIGVSRSGKSTFAKMLHDKYNYNIIHGDMIKASFQNNIKNISGTELKEEKNYRNFIKDIFKNEVKYNEINYAIDTVDIFPSDITNEEKENFVIYCFGYLDIEFIDLLNFWKEKDEKFVKKFTEDELISKAKRCIERSKILKEECEKNSIVFIDTSHDMDKIFDKLINEIGN